MSKNNIPEYKNWKAMKSRCYSPSFDKVGGYRKNNIIVCKEWINDFDCFLKDMGKKPSEKHTLDRIDNSKEYSKENCKWSTRSDQAKNRGSFNLVYTHNNESMVLKDWSRKLNIKYSTLYLRIKRSNLSFEDAIKKDPFNKLININGEEKTLKDWCLFYGRKYPTVANRIHDGWEKDRAILTPTIF